MPHIEIRMYPGRSPERKAALAEKLCLACAEALSLPRSEVSVSVADVKPEDWDAAVSHIPEEEMFIEAGEPCR